MNIFQLWQIHFSFSMVVIKRIWGKRTLKFYFLLYFFPILQPLWHVYTLLELGTLKSLSISLDMALEVQNKLNLFFDHGLTGYDNQNYKKKLCYHSKKPKKTPTSIRTTWKWNSPPIGSQKYSLITLGVDILHTFTLIYYHFGGP